MGSMFKSPVLAKNGGMLQRSVKHPYSQSVVKSLVQCFFQHVCCLQWGLWVTVMIKKGK